MEFLNDLKLFEKLADVRNETRAFYDYSRDEQTTITYTYSPNDQLYYSPVVIIGSPEATVSKKEAKLTAPHITPDISPSLYDPVDMGTREYSEKSKTGSGTLDTLLTAGIIAVISYTIIRVVGKK